ncbi:MAG: DegT/DnrJ/EryC1/StrS family aminotransferase [Terricaulis sp.]
MEEPTGAGEMGISQVPFYRHALTADAAASVAEVLQSPFLTTGPRSGAVEKQLCAFFDVPHAKLVSSWTQGAVATLLALDIGPGDEVIVPAMTFVATANVVKQVGATPVFVDVDPATLLIDIAAVKAALTARTKAVIPVHLYGQMADIQVLRVAIGADVSIIEDAAHCFEGTRNGRRPGQDGDAAIFSFYATKNVTCGEGGAVITRHKALADTLTQTCLHGMSAGAAKRFEGGRYNHWDVARLGVKANLPDLLAVLLGPQIDTVEQRRKEREALALRYTRKLSQTPLTIPRIEDGGVSAFHLFPIHVPNGMRDKALQILGERGIGATVNYRAVTELTLYRNDPVVRKGRFPHSVAWGEGTLTLPLFPGLTEAEQDYVCDVVVKEIAPLLTDRTTAKKRHAL